VQNADITDGNTSPAEV
jgi:hypothetical protein